MKIIIDIPEDVIESTKSSPNYYPTYHFEKIWKAIVNGTPLPKGHGRLIDADAFLKDNDDYTGWILYSKAWGGENGYKDALEDLVTEAPTIIEADKESEDKE